MRILLLFFVLSLSADLRAITFTINSNTDANDHTPGDGLCDWNSGTPGEQCSLRAAILEANATTAADVINVPSRGSDLAWTHSGSTWRICQPLTIRGSGGVVDIAGSATSSGSVFYLGGVNCPVNKNASPVILDSLRIIGTQSPSRAIEVSTSGDLFLKNSVVTGFSGNGLANKQAIYSWSSSSVAISRSRIVGNNVRAVQLDTGDNLIEYTEISGNTSDYTAVMLTGALVTSTLVIRDSLIADNYSPSSGAGVLVAPNAELYLVNTTVSGNISGGSFSGVILLSSPISTATGGRLEAFNSTIVNNRAFDDDDTPPIGLPWSGLVVEESLSGDDDGSALIVNTLVAGNTKGSQGHEIVSDCGGPVESGGYNFLGNSAGCTITEVLNSGTDILDQDPDLLALADNGGPARTHAVGPSSLVIDGGNMSGCVDHESNPLQNDQRGLDRPRNARCDIGALEFFGCPNELSDITVSGMQVSDPRLDQACGSVLVDGDSEVVSFGYYHVRSPFVSFAPGFRVAARGQLKVSNVLPSE